MQNAEWGTHKIRTSCMGVLFAASRSGCGSRIGVNLHGVESPANLVVIMPDKKNIENEIIHPEAVELVKGMMLSEDEYSGIAGLFKNFGDTTRVRILHYLQGGELCVSDLTALLGVTKSAVSHQLQALKLSKLVRSRRDGQIIYYSLDDDHVKLILNMALDHLREG